MDFTLNQTLSIEAIDRFELGKKYDEQIAIRNYSLMSHEILQSVL